jgi:aldehyde dehydrogenase
MSYDSRYGNFIGGEWVPPVGGEYFDNPTPITGQAFCEIPRSTDADIEKALDAAHAAAPAWGKTAPADRALILNKIADRIEANLESLALAESWDNGKPIRETLNADLPLAVDHFRYFAARRKGLSPRSTRTPSHTTSMSRSAWSARSFRGTSRS